jgi:hypothetical protein
MAAVLRLANVGQTTTVDLLGSALKLRAGRWGTRTPAQESQWQYAPFGAAASFQRYSPIVETFELTGQGSGATLLAAVGALEAFQEKARRWHNDPLADESVWLEWHAAGENTKRSLVYDLGVQYPASLGMAPLMPFGALAAQLTITRHPLWENVDTDTYTTPTLSCLGGQWALTPGAACTAPARIRKLILNGVSGSGPLYRVWVGIRPVYAGFTNFLSTWECEDSDALLGTDADRQTGGGASGGGWVRVTFATAAGSVKRLTIKVADVTSNYQDQLGHYQLLCRCKVDSGTAVALDIRQGSAGMADADHVVNEPAYITNTSWQLIELGRVQIPPSGWRAAHGNNDIVKSTQFQLWAERLSGTGYLHLDCLVFIPATHFVKVEGAAIQYQAGSPAPFTYPAEIITDENDTRTALAYLAATSPAAVLQPVDQEWYLPTDGGLLVLAAERQAEHVLAEYVYPVMYTHPRWLSFRGA